MQINFYTTKTEYGFCSNFFRAKILLDGKEWRTTEHYYQAMKSVDPEQQELVRSADTPKVAAMLGRTVVTLRPDWEAVKYDVMKKAVTAKFQQHPNLMEKLLATGKVLLVENTVGTVRPDPVWGNGADGKGLNLLGKILMEIRENARLN